MPCDVFIGSDYGIENDYYETFTPVARVARKCCECGATINPGEKYERAVGVSERSIKHWSYKTCLLCKEIRDTFTCGEGFVHSALWDDMEEQAFPNLTLSSDCFTQLSVAAKQKVIERWSAWKGL